LLVIEIYFRVYLLDQLLGLQFEVIALLPVYEDALHGSFVLFDSDVDSPSTRVEEGDDVFEEDPTRTVVFDWNVKITILRGCAVERKRLSLEERSSASNTNSLIHPD
jgi:hypothetical protein